ncbi:MAG: hypothetical protein ACLU3I_11200 [Acutalibacteraceae bacterium]
MISGRRDSATLASLAGLDLKAGMDASFLPAYEVLFQSSIPETDSMTVSADALDAFLSGEQVLPTTAALQTPRTCRRSWPDATSCTPCSRRSVPVCSRTSGRSRSSPQKETACAVRFLSYLLSEDGQRCLYLENQYPSASPVSSTVYEAVPEYCRRACGQF